MDELNKLFCRLSSGGPVSFLEVMAAINEISNLWPDTRPGSQEPAVSKKSNLSDPDYPFFEPGESCELCG